MECWVETRVAFADSGDEGNNTSSQAAHIVHQRIPMQKDVIMTMFGECDIARFTVDEVLRTRRNSFGEMYLIALAVAGSFEPSTSQVSSLPF